MSISFDDQNNVITLETKNTVYAMKILQDRFLVHLYYGNKAGRESADDRVCFIAGGMPVWDVAWGTELYRKAKEQGVGQNLLLWDDPELA